MVKSPMFHGEITSNVPEKNRHLLRRRPGLRGEAVLERIQRWPERPKDRAETRRVRIGFVKGKDSQYIGLSENVRYIPNEIAI